MMVSIRRHKEMEGKGNQENTVLVMMDRRRFNATRGQAIRGEGK